LKKLLWAAFAVFVLVCNAHAQSGNSNVGTEFWTAYMDHIDGVTGTNASSMILYIASDINTSGTVTIADASFSPIAFTVKPNIITQVTIPAAAFTGNVTATTNKGIHITSVNPIAVYAHIFASSRSGATLLIPVNTLSTDYTSINYKQISNTNPVTDPSYSAIMVIATEDNTVVSITPSADLISNGPKAGIPYTLTLNKGQVYQGLSSTDLTGTKISSASSAGCKKIAFFSGSSKISIGYSSSIINSTNGGSADNLFQQVYPTASWGKNFITVPLKTRFYDIFRVVVSDPTAVVTNNGTVLTNLVNNLYYEFPSASTNVISSAKPIQVVQYAVTQNEKYNFTTKVASSSSGDIGDPEMIYLNPIEQNIDHVTLYSAQKFLILGSYVNVVLPTSSVSSFLLDGVSAANGFTPVANTTYSSAQFTVATGATHTLSANAGFNAIAYGFGANESYGYAAGTNVKNLNEYIQYANLTTNQTATSGCTGASLYPQIVLPYQTSSITWDFGNGTTPVVQAPPTLKSTFVKNGTTLYLYDYGSPIVYQAGSYAVKTTVFNPLGTICGSNEEVDLNFNVADPPTAKFSSRDTLCITDTLGFKDLSVGNGSAIQSWHWDFGNGDTSIVQNPVYKYLTPGDYTVALTVTIPTGCQSVFTKKVHVRAAAVSAFKYSTPDCETMAVLLTDQSNPSEGKILQWIWNYGDGTAPEIRTNNTPFTHTYATAGNYTVTLKIVTDKACSSATLSKVITVHNRPVVAFALPDVCLANAVAQFTDQSTIADNSAAQFTYIWDFGDVNATVANPNTAIIKAPTHQFTKAGTYHISLTVTSKDTCSLNLTKDFIVSGQANFAAPIMACPADTVVFTDKTDGAIKATSAWHWDFGDGDTSAVQSSKHPFINPGDYNVVLTVKGHNGCSTTSYAQNIHINKKPDASFTNSPPVCETKAITFTDTSIPKEGNIVAWNWDFGDGTTSNLQSPVHTFTPFNTYNIKLIVTTDLGCSSVAYVKALVVNPQPVASFIIPDVCVSDGAAFFNAKSDANAISYVWNFGDNASNISATNPNTATGLTVSHHYTTAQLYTATLTVTTANGCVADTVKQFRVNGSSPKADFNVLNGNALCSSNEVIFTNKTTIPGFGDAVTSVDMYYDYANNPTVKTHYERPAYGQALRHLYPLDNAVSHQYAVHMIAYSGTTCLDTKDMVVTLLPVPLTTFSALPDVCQDAGLIKLLDYTTAHGPDGTPKFYVDGNYLASGKFDPSTAALGQHKISFIYTANATSCADTLYQNITVAPIPTVSAGPALEVIAGESVTLQATASSGNLKIRWTPSAGLSDSTILNPKASPKADTRYKITVTLTTGGISCPVSDSVLVKLLSVPIIPNTFTPNGDGYNDKWEIKYLDRYSDCSVKVYNRAGELVYSNIGYTLPWDGTYKGTPLPVGTYYYIIDPGHKLDIMTGSVNIIK
jgi:gliding motility-associated-like protein